MDVSAASEETDDLFSLFPARIETVSYGDVYHTIIMGMIPENARIFVYAGNRRDSTPSYRGRGILVIHLIKNTICPGI